MSFLNKYSFGVDLQILWSTKITQREDEISEHDLKDNTDLPTIIFVVEYVSRFNMHFTPTYRQFIYQKEVEVPGNILVYNTTIEPRKTNQRKNHVPELLLRAVVFYEHWCLYSKFLVLSVPNIFKSQYL